MQSKKYNYLLVDDEQNIITILSNMLAIHPDTLSVFTAKEGEKAVQIYLNNDIDIVITDVLMPQISGIDLIKKIRGINAEASIIIISALGNLDIVRDAMRNGAYDYIIKPFTIDDIMFSINRVIDRLRLLDEKKNCLTLLERKSSFIDALKVIDNVLEVKDRNIKIHSQNVAEYSVKLALAIGLCGEVIDNIKTGSILHDIGKIGIPDYILQKKSSLSSGEFEIIKKHPIIGRQIVEPMFGKNEDIINIIYYHHEMFDGGGYPEGLKGDKIPLSARIVSLVNEYDRMVNEKSYDKHKTREEAMGKITMNVNRQFDSELSKEFLKII